MIVPPDPYSVDVDDVVGSRVLARPQQCKIRGPLCFLAIYTQGCPETALFGWLAAHLNTKSVICSSDIFSPTGEGGQNALPDCGANTAGARQTDDRLAERHTHPSHKPSQGVPTLSAFLFPTSM